MLIGRRAECEVLDSLAAGEVLVLRGEAGVGKSALLGYLLERAGDARTTQVCGVRADMDLAYAGLQQLCRPLLGFLADLSGAHHDPLTVALGLRAGQAPSPDAVAAAVGGLLAAAGRDRRVVCVVDNAQWVDPISLQVLESVADRVRAAPAPLPVVMMFAARGDEVVSGLRSLVVGALSDEAARELLGAVVPGRLDPRIGARMIAEARGNPAALLKCPGDLAGHVGAPSPAEQHYTALIGRLPEATQRLLTVAAAEPVGDASVLGRALSVLGIVADAAVPAVRAGVVEIEPRIRFCHPYARSAAYRAADPMVRRDIHRALADATDAPEDRAWHAANATAWPDDAVAAQLESAAGHAQADGRPAGAAEFLSRAAMLSVDPGLRGSRAVAAARLKLTVGASADARGLLAMADRAPLPPLVLAERACLRAELQSASRDLMVSQLLDAAGQFESLEDERARETYLQAIAVAIHAGRFAEPSALGRIADAAREAVDRMTTPPGPADTLLRSVIGQLIGGPPVAPGAGVAPWIAPILQQAAAYERWDDALAHQLSSTMLRTARQSGVLTALPEALGYRSVVHLLAGEFASAESLLTEADSRAALVLGAWQGDPAHFDAVRAAGVTATARGDGRLLSVTGYATAVLCNGLGRYEEGFAAAQHACEYEDLGLHGWCLFELIESATRVGDIEAARHGLKRLADRVAGSDTDWALGTLAGAQALVADDDAAEPCFREAISRLSRTRVAVHHARAHLQYGEWLRRRRRRTAAREHLTVAHEMFSSFGAAAFAERARRELIVKGEKNGDLTAQERQVAQLAGAGLTNAEIGKQLFISTHTVEWHLRKVFVKLGVRSRRQLRGMSLST